MLKIVYSTHQSEVFSFLQHVNLRSKYHHELSTAAAEGFLNCRSAVRTRPVQATKSVPSGRNEGGVGRENTVGVLGRFERQLSLVVEVG